MTEIYGTIGPACADPLILKKMFEAGMTGMRLNTSHISVEAAKDQILMIQNAAKACGKKAKILIDMQGPELRIGKLKHKLMLETGSQVLFTAADRDNDKEDATIHIPIAPMVIEALKGGMEVLLDDGKILLEIDDFTRTYGKTFSQEELTDLICKPGRKREKESISAHVKRGGLLSGGKSIALSGSSLKPPAMTEQDHKNIIDAVKYGISGVMQPFVRDAKDLEEVKAAIRKAGGSEIALFAKIENMDGVRNLESFFGIADEIVIARGDLGNAMPLWELPRVQKDIEKRCLAAGVPFMVVTQMLASMEHNAVPTRAEVSDIYNAVCDGASSVMVTGETAVGEYPVEVITYLANTVESYNRSRQDDRVTVNA